MSVQLFWVGLGLVLLSGVFRLIQRRSSAISGSFTISLVNATASTVWAVALVLFLQTVHFGPPALSIIGYISCVVFTVILAVEAIAFLLQGIGWGLRGRWIL